MLEEGGVQAPAPQRQARLLEHLRSELFVDVQVLKEKLGVAVALSTLWLAVARLGLTVKKKSTARRSKTART